MAPHRPAERQRHATLSSAGSTTAHRLAKPLHVSSRLARRQLRVTRRRTPPPSRRAPRSCRTDVRWALATSNTAHRSHRLRACMTAAPRSARDTRRAPAPRLHDSRPPSSAQDAWHAPPARLDGGRGRSGSRPWAWFGFRNWGTPAAAASDAAARQPAAASLTGAPGSPTRQAWEPPRPARPASRHTATAAPQAPPAAPAAAAVCLGQAWDLPAVAADRWRAPDGTRCPSP